jgi:hypothetical protein
MTAADFPLNRSVVIGTGSTVIGSNGSAVVESVDGDLVTLRISKGIHRTIRASRVETLTVFPDIQIVGAR